MFPPKEPLVPEREALLALNVRAVERADGAIKEFSHVEKLLPGCRRTQIAVVAIVKRALIGSISQEILAIAEIGGESGKRISVVAAVIRAEFGP